ncbi:TKL/RAF/KSR protein kinase [Loa loa]|uniref:TKL/RAF/KSR protein kinase n=1 Tax=Loa loa TaxID=7209 RepID=A0A1I7VV78_LOALO|nr:TKL/RAF/KSR protein kinase [Loa loa]EJD74297.1 TKL/RAF/KSR protein kinase [Loa loa]
MPNTALRVDKAEWLQKVEQSLHAIDIIGRKLITGRSACRNIGSEPTLIQLEAKLIRLASQVCYLNQRYRGTKYPSLNEWLTYVNLLPREIVTVLECLQTFCVLITTNDKQLLDICERFRFTSDGRRRLRKSSYSLRSYVSKWKDEAYEPVRAFSDRDLCWMSFDHLASSDSKSFPYENTAESSASDSGSGVGSNLSQSSLPTTTPPASPSVTIINTTLSNTLNVFPRSTGEKKSVPNRLSTTYLMTDGLMRSHSHESNLQYTVNSSRGSGLTSSRSINDCLSVVNHGATLSPSSSHLNYVNQMANTMPRTPKTARAKHSIPHQWHRRKGFRISTENCHFCQRQLNFFSEYEKCKSCKWKVHPHCKEKIGDSCGLTPAYLKQALKEMFMKDIGNDGWTPSEYSASSQQAFPFDPVDSSSSANSSAPSTPAFPTIYSGNQIFVATLPTSSPFLLPSAPPSSYKSNFDFPEAVPEVPDIVVEGGGSEQQCLISSQGSDCTVNSSGTVVLGGSEGSEGTLFIDSMGSNGGNFDNREELDGSKLSPYSGCSLNRDRWSNGTIRVPNNWNDFTIPFSQIEFKKQSLIGKGRFGEVHKANWYGDVAVKLLNMDHVDEEKQLEAFKVEVASFKNTRHDNIVLFLGYTFDQHKLGIVMHYCKGRPLHQLLHDHYEKFNFTEIVHFATQICQGVSYLHTKKIIHKDLRTKNIFVESRNRIVLTDFGLFNMKRLGQPHRNHILIVPQYWLCYVAPELIKALSAELIQLPFTENSDVYAFGTIWYELMTYRFPFRELHPDVVIWKVGCGFKAPVGDISGPREVKDILVQCWNYAAEERPSLRDISGMLERFPKKRLGRSPSFPVSRSYESVF